MASNPNSNLRDEPEYFPAAAAAAEERRPDDIEDPGSILDSESDDDIGMAMAMDDEDSDDDGFDDSESDNDDDDDDDDDDDEDEKEDESCKQSATDCPICFRRWSSDGPHRICCIPCGHVYGRSCIEKWLLQCRKNTGKCPQCNRKFKQKEIFNLYVQLTAATNDNLVNPSEVVNREGGERVQAQGEQQRWRLTKENWDVLCSRVKTLSTRNDELSTRLDGFEGRIIKMLEGFESKMEKMSDATGERLGKMIDENFKKLCEFYKNSTDISKNPFDISSPNSGVAPPAFEGSFGKILDAMEKRIGKKIDENFKEMFDRNPFRTSSPNFGPAPSTSMPNKP